MERGKGEGPKVEALNGSVSIIALTITLKKPIDQANLLWRKADLKSDGYQFTLGGEGREGREGKGRAGIT